MSVFGEEDSRTVKLIGAATAGFVLLTVALIVLANVIA